MMLVTVVAELGNAVAVKRKQLADAGSSPVYGS